VLSDPSGRCHHGGCLLPQEQLNADLKAGRGMGIALPAELNGNPGPAHLLEIGNQLSQLNSAPASNNGWMP
jgi:hypothetical protein